MPRKPRLEYPGACYHIMARGNRREAIFADEQAKAIFIRTLGESCQRCGWKVHAYALMDNHYHILLETPQANLIAGMSWLQSTYTSRHNRLFKQCGHVFSGRYKAILVQMEGDHYFNQLATYIHLNPARAKIYPEQDTDFIHAHRWTSLYWLDKTPQEQPSWYTTEKILLPYGDTATPLSRQHYLQNLNNTALREKSHSGTPCETEQETLNITPTRGWIYGSIDFREQMRQLSKFSIAKHTKGDALDYFLKIALRTFGLTLNQFLQLRKSASEKIALGMILRESSTLSHQQIATSLAMGNPVYSGRLINKALKDKENLNTPTSQLYEQLSEAIENRKTTS